jgi:hypothetical protein
MISWLLAIGATVWLIKSFRREPAFLLVAAFLGWQFALKIYGVSFLDSFGPIYSEEVSTEVGGKGYSAPLMIGFVMIPLVAMKLSMRFVSIKRPLPLEKNLEQSGLTFGDLIATALVVLLVCLYVDLFRIGQIPLFHRMERFEYKGGVFHVFMLNYLFLIAHAIGFALARTRLLTGEWDVRFAGIVFGLFAYLFLTGHRFGSFYMLLSFAMVPMAALFVAPRMGLVAAKSLHGRSMLQQMANSRFIIIGFALVLVTIVLIAMTNSLLNVRDGDPRDALLQRFLVQPVHLYWLTWERLINGDSEGMGAAAHFIFNDPLDAARNTGIQYLMYLHLGLNRASEIWEGQEVDYAGGYPEILIELGGVWLAAAAAVLASVAIATLYRLAVVAVCRGQFMLSMIAIYVCFGVLSLFFGGMVTFLVAETYWLKLGALTLLVFLSRSRPHSAGRLLPWVLTTRGKRHRLGLSSLSSSGQETP